MASNDNIDCTLTAEIDVTQDVATSEEVIDVELITYTDEQVDTIPRIEVELSTTQWSLVSDAIFIKNITGDTPQWFDDMIDEAIRTNEDLLLEFQEIQAYIDALEDGYTNLVSVTDDHATQLQALKVSSDENTAAITILYDVKITEKQASAISSEVITAWMRGGESAAWFNQHVQAVATDTSANTLAIMQLSANVDGYEAVVTEMSEALVEKYQNPEWNEEDGTDPDSAGQPKWVYEARAKHSLEVNANGSVSGFIADAVSGPEGAKSSFKIFADEFLICDKLDDSGQPGHTAFLIKSSSTPGEPPLIAMDGDVYIGTITDGTGAEVPYHLFDISDDDVVDPVEKDALEKTFSDLRERDLAFFRLVYDTNARYGSLVLSYPTQTAAYTVAYQDLQCMMAQLGIVNAYLPGDDVPATGPCSTIDPDTYVGNKPYAPTPITSRADFNAAFVAYDVAYNILQSLMEDLVKEIADNSYNLLVEIFSDGKLSPEEKTTIINYLDTQDTSLSAASDYMLTIGAIPDCATYPYPGNGFEAYSRAAVVYVPYRKYSNSYLCTVGDDIEHICPCAAPPEPTCPPLPTQPMNGFKTQMNLPAYDLLNPVETILTAAEANDALASFEFFLSSRGAYLDSLTASVIDTTFIRIEDPASPGGYTLIIDDTIETGVLGDSTYLANDTRLTGNGIDVLQAKIRISNDVVDTTFIIDSENDGSYASLCSTANRPNFRGKLMEATIGSFAQMYSGDTTMIAGGKYKVRNTAFQNTKKTLQLFQLGSGTFESDSLRFYSPTYTVNTPAVNSMRILNLNKSHFAANIAGGLIDRFSLVDLMKVEITLEYNMDNTNWIVVPNQILRSTEAQMVIFDNIHCNEFVDFRLVGSYQSNGFPFTEREIMLTIALHN